MSAARSFLAADCATGERMERERRASRSAGAGARAFARAIGWV